MCVAPSKQPTDFAEGSTIGSASISYRVAVTTFFLLWLIHLSGAFYDAFQDVGGSVNLWVATCSSGDGICVKDIRTNSEDYLGIEIGDEILELGGVSSLPTSHIEFRHALTSQFDGTVVVRRSEEKLTFVIPVPEYAFKTLITVKDLVLGLFAILVTIYARPSRLALAATAALFLYGATGQGAPIGPNATSAHVLVAVNIVSQIALWPALCMVILLILRPNTTNSALSACWIFALLGVLLSMVYFGGPFPPNTVLSIYLASFLFMIVIQAGILFRYYPATTGRSRKQANWVVGGFSAVAILNVTAYIISLYTNDESMLAYFLTSELSAVVFGFVGLGAILLHDLVPINKAAVVSASYAIVAVILALGFEFVLEPLASVASASLGMDPDVGQTALIVAVALAAPKLKSLITPFVEARVLEPDEMSSTTPTND